MIPSTPEPSANPHGTGVVVPSTERPRAVAAEDAPMRTKLKRLGASMVPLLVLGAALWSGLASCPNRAMTGIPCPGCGLTRASLALLSGDLAGALHWHPLVFLLLPLAGFLVLRSMLSGAGLIGASAWQVRVPNWLFIAFALLVFGVWGARLAGYLGGPSDPVDLRLSLFGRALTFFGVI
jgi:hypothetical protein